VGLALIWKPQGLQSQECLSHFKKNFLSFEKKSGKSQIGHSGTLDPFAEGWLLVGWEEGSKLLAPLMGLPKTYIVNMQFGQCSDTLDLSGKIEFASEAGLLQIRKNFESWESDSGAFLSKYLKSHLGKGKQVPPKFSALHVDGKRAYDLARAGVEFELKEREIDILDAGHLCVDSQKLQWTFKVTVSSGTYIRSFARDWGEELCAFPALLNSLTRTAIGPFQSKSTVDQLQKSNKEDLVVENLEMKDVEQLFDFATLSDIEAQRLQSFGRLNREFLQSSKPMILLNRQNGALAWLKSDTREIGRVFQKDPFAY